MTIHQVDVEIDGVKSVTLIAYNELPAHVAGILRINLEGYINSLWVDPSFRGRGLGTRLIEQACDLLREQGKQLVGLSVKNGNEGAKRLYKRLGFLPYLPNDQDDYSQCMKPL